ncbi:MAG: PorP/SprF family type IX secretion system membrane protein [Flavobacteriales bacterium]
MKPIKQIFLLFAVLFSVDCLAQQTAQFSQYLFDHMTINPAVAGSKECIRTHMGFREQWVDLKGSPTTMYVSGHSKFLSDLTQNPDLTHGIGGYIENDKFGPFQKFTVNAAYAIHLKLLPGLYGSAGAYVGVKQWGLDITLKI